MQDALVLAGRARRMSRATAAPYANAMAGGKPAGVVPLALREGRCHGDSGCRTMVSVQRLGVSASVRSTLRKQALARWRTVRAP
jgi:hypothetical protein